MTDSLQSHNSNPRNRVKGFASRGRGKKWILVFVSFVRLREGWLIAGRLFVEVIVGMDERGHGVRSGYIFSIRLTFFLRTLWATYENIKNSFGHGGSLRCHECNFDEGRSTAHAASA